jgi:maltose alpha-D-glucosyltransferase/alpha-amylase
MPLAERFDPSGQDDLEALLPDYLNTRRLTGHSVVTAAHVRAAVPVGRDVPVWFLLVVAEYREGVPELVSLSLAFVPDAALNDLAAAVAEVGLARIPGPEPGVLVDALAVPACARGVLRAILGRRARPLPDGELVFQPIDPPLSPAELDAADALPLSVRRTGRHTLTTVYGDQYVYKSYRRVDEGVAPALEIGRVLAGRPGYTAYAPVVGSVEYRRRGTAPATLGVLYRHVEHQGTAWQYTLDELSRYFERVAALSKEAPPRPPADDPLVGPAPEPPAADGGVVPLEELAGAYIEAARLLGRRTGEMHLALADPAGGPAFAPEEFGKLYQRSVSQTMRNTTGKVLRRLRAEADRLPGAAALLDQTAALNDRFRAVLDPAIGGARIRVHGDYHLGRLLFTGKDFVVTDFDGDTARSVEERRVKRSAFRDVAGMIRSFDYATRMVLYGHDARRGRAQGLIRPEDVPALTPWADAWFRRVSREFVLAYLDVMGGSGLLPTTEVGRRALLEAFVLEKALHELESELAAHPERAAVPLSGLLRMLGTPG